MDLSAAAWRRSTHSSGGGSGDCVEVATDLPGVVAVRDSKDPLGPALLLTPTGWTAFLLGVTTGEFDRR